MSLVGRGRWPGVAGPWLSRQRWRCGAGSRVVADAEHELRGAATAIGLAAERFEPPGELGLLLGLELDRMGAALGGAGGGARGAARAGRAAGRRPAGAGARRT